MWGDTPADCVHEAVALFRQQDVRHVLVPGFGYGRNAKVFADNGFVVTGIEISQTAIDIAKAQYAHSMTVHHGSVSEMPFDSHMYDGVFCYALIHLLNPEERAKLIRDCYDQLRPGGCMVFVAISTQTAAYGQGTALGENTFLTPHGVTIFYYDAAAVQREFGDFGLLSSTPIQEPAKSVGDKPIQKFWYITCMKPN